MRSNNTKVNRLLRAMALELMDLPYEKHKRLDQIINDDRDGYVYNWLGTVDWWRWHCSKG